MVPFARACVAAGHEVRVCAPASFADSVERVGLTHVPVPEPSAAELGAIFARLPSLSMEEANRVVVAEVFGGLDARAALPGVEAAVVSFKPDVLVREMAEFASFVVARRFDVPQVEISIGLAEMDVAAYGMVGDALARLGCPDGVQELCSSPLVSLVPESLDGVPDRPVHRFRYEPPPSTARGVPEWPGAADDPVVYASFGTVAASIGLFPDGYRALVDAVADLPVRMLLTVGESGDPDELGPTPAHVLVERFWPQQDVMPHARAMIGHGGFGTTMTGLANGVPMVVVPLFALDQFFNARAVERAGAGVVAELSDVSEALARILRDDSYRTAARRLAAEIAALPPASGSADVLVRAALDG
jgi:hypothetical protein